MGAGDVSENVELRFASKNVLEIVQVLWKLQLSVGIYSMLSQK